MNLLKHREYMQEMKELMLIEDCLENIDFWGQIYATEALYVKEALKQ